jgi:DNA-3-methyladenine glycosylase II
MPANPHTKAIRYLKKADPVLANVIDTVGRCTLVPRTEGTHFDYVVRSIVYQQLSGKAAGTIHGRFLGLFDKQKLSPAAVLGIDEPQLRSVGLSGQKAKYIRSVAEQSHSGELAIESLHEMTDEEIIAALTQIKGVGVWTAQMFLIFRLGRPDVLPIADLGIQKGVQRAYGLRKLPKPEKVQKIGKKWAPYRTVGSWYMWRLLDVT